MCFFAVQAWPADKAKATAAMASKAAEAIEKGDYARAAELYGFLWAQDHNSSHLWSLARAEHLGGAYDAAMAHYRQLLELSDVDAARKAKVREYIVEIDRTRAKAKAMSAEKAVRDGDARLAAQLFMEAWKLDPARLEWLFQVAVAEQGAGDLAAAETHLQEFLAKAAPNAPERSEAEGRLKSLKTRRTPAPAPEASAIESSATAPSERGVMPWVVGGVGAAALAGGVALFLSTSGDYDKFQADTKPDADGIIRKTSTAEAQTAASSINQTRAIAAGLGAVGAVGIGVATWLLVRTPKTGPQARRTPSPADVQVHVGVNSLVLAWRF